MAHLWSWFVSAVWPNLVASAIWGVPAAVGFVWHHRRIRDHISAEVRLLHAHRAAREVHEHEEAR